jgi:hypothetical protein
LPIFGLRKIGFGLLGIIDTKIGWEKPVCHYKNGNCSLHISERKATEQSL